jgi:hypothetical protein
MACPDRGCCSGRHSENYYRPLRDANCERITSIIEVMRSQLSARRNLETPMAWIDLLQRFERVMADIGVPRGIEGRDLRDRLGLLDAWQPTQEAGAEAADR